uniref:DUF952 domain-containing protein n=1 Tax=Fagus sylvatica TaxID=28930 RepID=A0A2N9JBT2_FAGSY
MASKEGVSEAEEFVYRISITKEWEELQKNGSIFGGELDKSSGFIHLSNLHQVQSTLQNFFLNTKEELYLLQIDAKKWSWCLVIDKGRSDCQDDIPSGRLRGLAPRLLTPVP